MLALAAMILLASAARPPAPAPVPADAAAILADVRKPGSSAVIVNVWASWCGPCREEFPDLLKVARDLSGRGVRLVLVSTDLSEAKPDVLSFLTAQGVDFPSYFQTGNDQEFIDGLDSRWSGAIPATFVYDAHGKLVRSWEGKASYDVIKKRVLDALAKENP